MNRCPACELAGLTLLGMACALIGWALVQSLVRWVPQ